MVRIAGVDLGARRDHTAVAMARLEGELLNVDACITIPLGTWQSQVDAVADLIRGREIAAIDSTGTGRMAYEAIHDRCPQALPYTLTAGNKQALITVTRKRMVRGTLAMNPDGEGIDLLVEELRRFQMMPTESGNWRYSGKRNGGDDRVFALLLAVAGAELVKAGSSLKRRVFDA